MLDHHCCLNFKDNLLNFKIPCTFRKFLQLHTYSLTFFCGKKWTSIYRCTHRFDVYFTSLYIIIIYIIYLYTYVSHPKGHIYKFPKKMKKKLCFFILIEWAFCIPPPVLAFSIPLNCFQNKRILKHFLRPFFPQPQPPPHPSFLGAQWVIN